MTEKTEILELVKKGLLEVEEGLKLLEEANDKTDNDDGVDEEDGEKKLPTKENNLNPLFNALAKEINRIYSNKNEVKQALQATKKTINEKKEYLNKIQLEEEAVSDEEIEKLEQEIDLLERELEEIQFEKKSLEKELMEIFSLNAELTKGLQFKIELPDNLKGHFSKAVRQASEKVGETGTQIEKFVKQTHKSVFDTIDKTIDWKEITIKLPKLAVTNLEHQIRYLDVTSTVFDIKSVNGKVTFKAWDRPEIGVDINAQLYGKMSEETALEHFLSHSRIEVDHKRMLFHVPNKLVKTDLTFHFPKTREYQLLLSLSNNELTVDDLKTTKVNIRSVNSSISIKNLTASSLEIEGVNEKIDILQSRINDLIIDSINGTIHSKADIDNYWLSLLNGDIKLTSNNNYLRRIKAICENGNIKIALPKTIGLEGIANATFGNIFSRLTDVEYPQNRDGACSRFLHFKRMSNDLVYIDASTKTGRIFLKDSDEQKDNREEE